MIKNKYNCKQRELTTIGNLAWSACERHLDAFATFKPMYTAAYIAEKKAEIKAAEKMPSVYQRNGHTQSLRMHLLVANRTCLRNVQTLKRYIAFAFKAPFDEPQYSSIGIGLYGKALRNNWDITSGIMDKCINFLEENFTRLCENQNMPPAFPAQFQAAATAFDQLHLDFLESEENAVNGTADKIKAYNKFYDDFMMMFADAQIIFEKRPALLKQFTFSSVLYLVSGAGTAGIFSPRGGAASYGELPRGVTLHVALIQTELMCGPCGSQITHSIKNTIHPFHHIACFFPVSQS